MKHRFLSALPLLLASLAACGPHLDLTLEELVATRNADDHVTVTARLKCVEIMYSCKDLGEVCLIADWAEKAVPDAGSSLDGGNAADGGSATDGGSYVESPYPDPVLTGPVLHTGMGCLDTKWAEDEVKEISATSSEVIPRRPLWITVDATSNAFFRSQWRHQILSP